MVCQQGREGGAAMFGALVWLNWDLRGTKQLRLSAIKEKEDSPMSGAWPKITLGVTCLMTDDEGYWRRGVTYQKKAEQNLFGWGFVHISGEYVKGCWHSWTHHLPWLDVKLRNLASTGRTSLEFWRQDVECLILCKLQFWLWRGRKTKSSVLAGNIWKTANIEANM